MKRILLREDAKLLLEICSDLKQYMPLLNEVKRTYELLELGSWSDEIFKEIATSGINLIFERFTEHLENNLEKLNISSEIIRQNLIDGSTPIFQNFADYVKELRGFRPITYDRNASLKLKSISFENNAFTLTDQDKELILESDCRIYLETEKEVELYNNLKQLADSYNIVVKNFNDLKFKFAFHQGTGLAAIENVFLETKGDTKTVAANTISWAVNNHESRMKFMQKE